MKNNKKLLAFFSLILILILSLFLVACNNKDDIKDKPKDETNSNTDNGCEFVTSEVKYTFETNGGNAIEPIITEEKITLQTPTKEGYIFDGWYENKELTIKIITNMYFNKEDVTLYAKWLKDKSYDGKTDEKPIIMEVDIIESIPKAKEEATTYFRFVPRKTQKYIIKSTGSNKLVAVIWKGEESVIGTNPDEGLGNFEFEIEMTEGVTYDIEVSACEIVEYQVVIQEKINI